MFFSFFIPFTSQAQFPFPFLLPLPTPTPIPVAFFTILGIVNKTAGWAEPPLGDVLSEGCVQLENPVVEAGRLLIVT